MKRTNTIANADLAARIWQRVNELERDNPDMYAQLIQFMNDYLNQFELGYEIIDADEPNREELFPDLVNAPVEPWW